MAGADKKISELNGTTTFTLSDIFPLVSGAETKKATLDALKKLFEKTSIGGSVITLPAGAGLSNSDAGKLIQCKAGEAFVANRDTPIPGQAGQWKFEFTGALPKPDPTEYELEFTSIPVEGESIVFGNSSLIFTASGAGRNHIPIGATTEDCAQNLYDKLQVVPYIGQYFTATLDLPNSKVNMKFNAQWNTRFGMQDGTADLFAPPIGGATFEVPCNAILATRINAGSDTFIFNNGGILGRFTGGALQLSLFDIMNNNYAPQGQLLFGYKWAADEFELAENFEAAINALYPGDFAVSRIGAEVTITALNAPNGPELTDIHIANDSLLSYVSVQTLQANIAPYIDFLMAPVIGQLLFVDAGQAYISASQIVKVKLAGTESSNSWVSELVPEQVFNKLLIPCANGEVETLYSFAQAMGGGGLAPDFQKFLALYGNMYLAKSDGAPGDFIIAEKAVGYDAFLIVQFMGG